METQYAIIFGLIAAYYIYRLIIGRVKYSRLIKLMDSGEPYTIVDVRTPEEYGRGHIPGARNIPVDRMGKGAGKLKRDNQIVLYCQSGSRAASALTTLRNKGFGNCWNFGKISRWQGQVHTGKS